ncbi:MAG: HD-GYP domain-containing protein [Actinomycetota bacterium]
MTAETEIPRDFLQSLRVLYVEDDADVRDELARFLRRRFAQVDQAENGAVGLVAFEAGHYDVVVTDIKMPEMDGLEMAKRIKAHAEDIPVIVVTAYNETDYFMRAIEIGVDRYVKKPVDPHRLLDAIVQATRVHSQQKELEHARAQTQEVLTQTVAALARAIEKRDPYTDGHQRRVARLAVAIARAMGLGRDEVMAIRLAALVHDVGKIAIPVELLAMPRRLMPEEFALIRTHSAAGSDILGEIRFPWPIARTVAQHHERLDGSGYPAGTAGDDIALAARIVAVADVFEAMSSHRPYRPALGVDRAVEELRANRARLYDAGAVDACLALVDAGRVDAVFAGEEGETRRSP